MERFTLYLERLKPSSKLYNPLDKSYFDSRFDRATDGKDGSNVAYMYLKLKQVIKGVNIGNGQDRGGARELFA